ncbi:hypothetical protein K450DRAFT_242382 [Umbelopsis ramanniana AG]|uniref:rRNA adenine N(6)-methyltransferase n=1 Tax=Umbelopsis ramanniana AG TaxID=1314678 RepID=A0AAD5HEZ0_UMBRA|nr:uncharacterized protein K450DRAFT_242382 [Umbelopsis ramanniana AG]KAI8579498.1 hypothetical protein K450DRAFT_242382 [Umbelopsis ramanniana AG]
MNVKLPSVRDLVKLYGLSAKQTLSQNFIFDKNITDKIVRCAGITAADSLVVEVGPGPGLLTRSVLDTNVQHVVALEKDSRFIPTLTQLADANDHRLKILQGDAMKVPHSDILQLAGIHRVDPLKRIHIVGNLPFNVATPLLIQWLHLLQQRKGLFGAAEVWMTLMFQKEVAQRICAPVNTPDRGRLSVITQTLCSANIPYLIPSSAFLPKPKVDAAIVHLRPLQYQEMPFDLLEDVLRFFFTRKRKSASHILNLLQSQLKLETALPSSIDSNARPENITTQQFIQLAISLREMGIDRLS